MLDAQKYRPQDKNATNQRGNFIHTNQHPRKKQGNNASRIHHVYQQNPLHQHHLKTSQVHDSGTHCQHILNNIKRLH